MADPSSTTNYITSCYTGRYLFEDAPGGRDRNVSKKREAEGGWTHENNKPVRTTDEEYVQSNPAAYRSKYNRVHWKIVPVEGQPGKVLIESCYTGRYLFEAAPDGDVSSKREAEGGWIHENNKPALTADANYDNRAHWKIVPVEGQPGKVLIESCHTGRYLFEAAPIEAATDGLSPPKPVVTADANYDNRAHWKINFVAHVANFNRVGLPNVKSSRPDDIPHLWHAVDTTGDGGVPNATLELTWHDQGWGKRKGTLYARKDGGAWVTISTDTAEHEPTRESFAIPAEVLGGKLELAFSVGAQGGHKLFITNAEVEITDPKGPWKLRITRPLSLGTDGNMHHLHINSLEVYDQAGAKLKLAYTGSASEYVKQGSQGKTPDLAIDDDGATSNVNSYSHNAWWGDVKYGSQDHWMEFGIPEAQTDGSGHPVAIFLRNNHNSARLAGATLAVLNDDGSVLDQFTLTGEALQQYEVGVNRHSRHTQGWGERKETP